MVCQVGCFHLHHSLIIRPILSNNPQTIEELSIKHPSITIVSSIEQALQDDEIDLVINATPNDDHASHTKMALEAKLTMQVFF